MQVRMLRYCRIYLIMLRQAWTGQIDDSLQILIISGNDNIISVLDPKLYPEISFLTSKINLNDKSCPEIRYTFVFY